MAYKVAVVGATGNVGRAMLNVLAQRQFPISELAALASTRSTGSEVSFGDHSLKIKALDYYDFKGTDARVACVNARRTTPNGNWRRYPPPAAGIARPNSDVVASGNSASVPLGRRMVYGTRGASGLPYPRRLMGNTLES